MKHKHKVENKTNVCVQHTKKADFGKALTVRWIVLTWNGNTHTQKGKENSEPGRSSGIHYYF